ncbi:LysR family transcriptional regulator [Polaromonas jejuensis]|uniref:LysR family transcriptional regulator n=1 Tax=Polaromonas jejuensis TaxID=457502 RepID=A0ABW0Q645_9BURK|nr:LysR family transcriptional regulator [Polaromonas jejuensis]
MKKFIAKTQCALTAYDLQVLLALVRGMTLAEAARRLGADASTVFRSVQRIEKSLGQRLFERSRRGYLPTEPMLELARHAERIEAELEAARATAQRPHEGVSGLVRLTTTDAVLRGLVLPSLKPLLAQHPLLKLDMRCGNELASLSRRDADLALRATRKPPDHLVGRKLGTVRFVVCGSKGLKGAKTQALTSQRKKSVQDLNQFGLLETLDWIAPDESLPEHPSVLWRRKQLPKVTPRHYADGIVAVMDAIKAGLGVGIVPVFMLAGEPALLPLTETLPDCESDLWLLAHAESRHLRRIATVYEHFAENIRLA